VFVPGAYPPHTYVERTAQRLEATLKDALSTPGQVASLSGPSKPGKTVLVERVVGRDLLISISGASIRDPDQIWERACQGLHHGSARRFQRDRHVPAYVKTGAREVSK
jgi:hypothetical protein